MAPPTVRSIVGCMTGTSIDAIDAALVRVEGSGLGITAAFVGGVSSALGDLAPRLRALADQQPATAAQIATLAREFSTLHAEAVRSLLTKAGASHPDLVCVHGQTVYHKPPVSWQLFNPWPLAKEVGAPVVYDLRAADLASGGQGAPITPIADWVLLRGKDRGRAIVNLGGFCNVTLLARSGRVEDTEGFDVCACNLLLDAIARKLLNVPFDEDGRAAGAGEVHNEAMEDLGGVLASQSRAGRSLGTGDEVNEWVSRWRAHAGPNDLAATACEGLGRAIAQRLQGTDEIYLAGGGARNTTLTKAIADWSSAPVRGLDVLGVPGEYREAAEFAVLGALCQDRVPITLPGVTGVHGAAPVSGAWAGLPA